jgi:hypothetical protein
MDVLGYILVGTLLGGYLLWQTIVVCLRFGWWVLVLVLVADAAVLFGSQALAPFSFVFWKMWVFWIANRWWAFGRDFQMPRWPRVTYMRGPGKRRPRRFEEPMPWLRGPNSY